MKLYSYFRSSASYRVRIALNLKGIDYDIAPVHLVKGEQNSDDYATKNPSQLIPALELDDGTLISQSMAILEYLDEVYPTPPLLPSTPADKAIVRSMCHIIASDTHPLNNLRVLKYLTGELGIGDDQKQRWYAHWIQTNFSALEKMLARYSGRHAFGDDITMADVLLVPQVYNAERFNIDLSAYPLICAIAERCRGLDAFISASPQHQVDFEG